MNIREMFRQAHKPQAEEVKPVEEVKVEENKIEETTVEEVVATEITPAEVVEENIVQIPEDAIIAIEETDVVPEDATVVDAVEIIEPVQEVSETEEKVEEDLEIDEVKEVEEVKDNSEDAEAMVEELPAQTEEILPIITEAELAEQSLEIPKENTVYSAYAVDHTNISIMADPTTQEDISEEEIAAMKAKADDYDKLKTELNACLDTIVTQNKETELLREYIALLLDYAKVSKEELVKAHEQKHTLEQHTGRTIITL